MYEGSDEVSASDRDSKMAEKLRDAYERIVILQRTEVELLEQLGRARAREERALAWSRAWKRLAREQFELITVMRFLMHGGSDR